MRQQVHPSIQAVCCDQNSTAAAPWGTSGSPSGRRQRTFSRSASCRRLLTSASVPNCWRDWILTGLTTTPRVVDFLVGSTYRTVAPDFSVRSQLDGLAAMDGSA